MIGPIDDNNFKDGIRKCLINAEKLIEDAILLKQNGRLPRAYTLFQLAIEELGKSSVLYFFATLNDEDKKKNLKNFKSEFSSHKIKTGKAINFDVIILMSIEEEADRHKFLNASLKEHETIEKYNELKNNSLYTSLIGNEFFLPDEIINEDLVNNIEARATMRLELIKSTLESLLKSFTEVKASNIQFDSDEIKMLADEFIADFLNGKG